jgi:3',5'-cyclic-AMP phosphodiesterase
MKIAHISDLHFSTFFKNSNLQSIKHLLKYIIHSKVDHIVITGDLTDNADPKDFEIIRKLFKSFNILSSDRLSLVIGNHDIFGGLQTPEDILNFPEKCKNVQYDKMIKLFGDYYFETFSGVIKNDEKYFPFIKELDDIQFLGLNSIARYSKVKNPFGSNGKITDEELIEAGNLLRKYPSENQKRIVLVHHHFNRIKLKKNSFASGFWQKIEKQTMKLKKKKRIISFFKEYNVDVVLHGHWHSNMEYSREQIRFFNAGATIKGNFPNELQINYVYTDRNIITMETHKLVANSPIIIHRNSFREGVEKANQEAEELKIAANY